MGPQSTQPFLRWRGYVPCNATVAFLSVVVHIRRLCVVSQVLLGLVSLGFPFASFLLLYRFRNRLHESKIQRRLLFLYSGACAVHQLVVATAA